MWIKTADQLPVIKTDVLCHGVDGSMFVGCLLETYDFTGAMTLQWHQHLEVPNYNLAQVDAWMNLPSHP